MRCLVAIFTAQWMCQDERFSGLLSESRSTLDNPGIIAATCSNAPKATESSCWVPCTYCGAAFAVENKPVDAKGGFDSSPIPKTPSFMVHRGVVRERSRSLTVGLG